VKTIELRSLLTEKEKQIEIPEDIEKAFDLWLEKRKKKTDVSKVKLLEIFYAGYVLSNTILREQYRNSQYDLI
jgi:hypothetical protein